MAGFRADDHSASFDGKRARDLAGDPQGTFLQRLDGFERRFQPRVRARHCSES
jgi:hypothetical protein